MNSADLARFERIAESIRNDIRKGRFEPGTQLPPQRELAKEHGVAVPTLRDALRVLQEQGWLTSRPTVGVFVNDPANWTEPMTLEAVSRRLTTLEGAVADLAKRLEPVAGDHEDGPTQPNRE